MFDRLVASASSTHPVPSHAVGEVIGAITDSGVRPDLALLVMSGGHAGALEDAARATATLLQATELVGLSAPGGPISLPAPSGGASLWVASVGPVTVVHQPSSTALARGPSAQFSLVFACARSVDVGEVLRRYEGVPMAGGTICGGTPSEAAQFVVDGRALSGGVVSIALPTQRIGAARHADGWVPLGAPMPATAVAGSWIMTIGGRPAAEPIEAIAGLDGAPGQIALGVLHGGSAEADPDVVAVRVTAIDPKVGSVEVDRPISLGALVQLLLWRPQASTRRLGAALGPGLHPPHGALALRPFRARFDPFGVILTEPDLYDPAVLGEVTVMESFAGATAARRCSGEAVSVVSFTTGGRF